MRVAMTSNMLWSAALLALWIFSGASSQKVCGYYEEGKSAAMTCSIKTSPFSRFGPRIGINGVFEEMSYCDSSGQCTDTDATRFQSAYSYDSLTGRRNVTLGIREIHRNMTLVRCYMDGSPLPGIECSPFVYIRPSKPTCSNIEFVDGYQAVAVNCTSDRVYPSAICGLKVLKSDGDFEENNRLSVNGALVNSTKYSGDRELTCEFRKYLPGIEENRYTFQVRFYAPIPDRVPTFINANSIPVLFLRAPALEYSDPATFDPVIQDFKLNFYIMSNPPTYSFSLSVRFDETSASTPVSSQYYSATYTGNRGGDYMKGTIQLTVETSAFSNEKRTGFFTFTASNGVVKSTSFAVPFTIIRYNIAPTQALCESPGFVNGGAAAVIRCKSDRIYPSGQCDFELSTDTVLRGQATMSTTNSDSTVYPGDKQVTCELRVPVVGNSVGQYQFQVKITPSINPVNLSTSVTTPPINLAPTQHSGEDGLAFTFPDSGDLLIDVHVTGNPAPSRVTLSVMQIGGSRQLVPVSSQDFRWTYVQTLGYQAGTIQVSLSRSLKMDGVRSYRLKAGNGVVDGAEFQYNFMVGRVVLPTQPVCEEPVFVDSGATAVVTCTSDRLSPPSTCAFTPTIGSTALETNFDLHRAGEQDSTTYPGYKRVTCALQIPVTGNRDGDYQFHVEFTSVDMSKSQPTLTPTISLKATVLYDPNDNNHTFENLDGSDLDMDVHVTGNPAPTRVTLRMRQGENSKSVPVSSRDFRWNYERTVGSEAGVIQLSVAGGSLKSSGTCEYSVSVENGVKGQSTLEYRFTVDYGTPPPTSEEKKSSDNILPVAAGAGAGGVVLIIVIIVVVVVVVMKRKKHPSTPQSDYDYAKPDFDPPISTMYPNFGYSPDDAPPYTVATSPYLRPISDRPDSTYAVPEYSEIEEFQNPDQEN